VRSHAVLGAQMLRHIGFPDRLCDVVKQHHERLDGSGYPEGLIAAQLSIEARVLAVADVVDAMLSRRPYRPARELHPVFDALDLGAGRLYDTRVVDAAFEFLEARVDEALESTPVA
jgi:HD-GYP domain-containing protein (c-di-GMP phosphodiesterase class II)